MSAMTYTCGAGPRSTCGKRHRTRETALACCLDARLRIRRMDGRLARLWKVHRSDCPTLTTGGRCTCERANQELDR